MSYNAKTQKYEGYIYKIYNDVNDKVYIGQTITTIKRRWKQHLRASVNETRYKSAIYNAIRKHGKENFHVEQLDKIEKDTKEELIECLNNLEQQRISEYHSLCIENGYNVEKGGSNKKVDGRTVCKYDLELNLLDTYPSMQEAGRQNNISGCTIWAVCRHDYYTAGGYIWAYEDEEPIKPKPPKPRKKKKRVYVSKALPDEVELARKLERIGDDGRKIYQYNSFGELINTFENLLEASKILKTEISEIRKNLTGENLCFKRTVLRYEDEPFDKYPRSPILQSISVYNLQGELISNFETIIDAERFVGTSRGEVLKTMKRGGSYKDYLFSPYGQPLVRKTYQWTRKIEMLDENDNVIKIFNSKKEVANYFGKTDVHKPLNNAIKNQTSYKDYYWRYQGELKLTV